jgi:hypothetical protein
MQCEYTNPGGVRCVRSASEGSRCAEHPEVKTTSIKFEPHECFRCSKSDLECGCEGNLRSLKSQNAAYKKAGYAELEMHAPKPPAVLLFLLSRAAQRLRYTVGVTIYHWLWLDLHLDCGVWGDGANGAYEWFVLEKLPDGSYQLESSDMGYGSAPYALKTVLQKMDGRGCL